VTLVARSTDPTLIGEDVRAVLRWDDATGRRRAHYLHEGDTVQLGRGPDNDVVLRRTHISRHRAAITWREGAFAVADLGSTNGTQVDGEVVTQPRVLRDGNIFRLPGVELSFYELRQPVPALAEEEEVDITLTIPADAAQPRLIITAGPQEGREISLRAGKMLIGRATTKLDWDIALQDRAISRPHAEIESLPECCTLTDLDSANGTLVNGETICEPTALQDGDVLELGEITLLFRAR
jgi:pSer/pThr/pTyr-binding forkhead associated (FHA) protein